MTIEQNHTGDQKLDRKSVMSDSLVWFVIGVRLREFGLVVDQSLLLNMCQADGARVLLILRLRVSLLFRT